MSKLLPFFLLILLLGCNQQQGEQDPPSLEQLPLKSARSCIEQVLHLDDSLGTVRNHACETISLSETIDNYTLAMANLPFKDCPNGFVNAYQAHREAWVKMKAITDKHPELRGELHDIFNQIEATEDSTAFKPLLGEIWNTWKQVEQNKSL